ncbi:hypothetical protein BB561_000248 [Smittium simulii]|uniref:Transcription elongation factor 1 homolog n=1 Tax=Smittium simulii TaxID=133385 RepID=A0A2T9YZS8_9FUNG|nr:hypothetical protein BB561_000248 [Smittium simulii]
MGKRKTKTKLVKSSRPKLDTQFDCLFCNHEKTVSVTMSRDVKIGYLSCKVCKVTYEARINKLSMPIDVYSEWIDACDDLKKREAKGLPLEPQNDNDDYGYNQNSDRDEDVRYANKREKNIADEDSSEETYYSKDKKSQRFEEPDNYFSGDESAREEPEYDEDPEVRHKNPAKRAKINTLYSDE